MEKIRGDVRLRLQQAALQLYIARGYDQTTAAQIAEQAGVTERTFFRHFPDKREILFDGQGVLLEGLNVGIAAAPSGLAPLDILFEAFHSLAKMLEANRAYAKPRHDLICRTPALQERELAKAEALAEAMASALRARGIAERPAILAARTGMAAFVHATVAWLDDPSTGLREHLELVRQDLYRLLPPTHYAAVK